jgi:phospholipid-binding lipoprotein MlaA
MTTVYRVVILSALLLALVSSLSAAQDLPSSPPETFVLVASSGDASPMVGGADLSEPSEIEESEQSVADPLEPANRFFFQVNDKLYFWVLRPIAKGYKGILPEDARIGVRNFLSNLTTPIRLANCLLQAKWKSAGNETFRFVLNSTLGLGGLLDPAKKELKIEKTEADFGQTLGIWGLGPAFYIDWPLLGPSNLRDSIGFAGDFFLDPRTYIFTKPIFMVIRPIEIINDTSLTLGQYEELKKAALDPYIAVREAYHQYRQSRIKSK